MWHAWSILTVRTLEAFDKRCSLQYGLTKCRIRKHCSSKVYRVHEIMFDQIFHGLRFKDTIDAGHGHSSLKMLMESDAKGANQVIGFSIFLNRRIIPLNSRGHLKIIAACLDIFLRNCDGDSLRTLM